MDMKSKTVFETAVKAHSLFYRKCKQCDGINVNYGCSEHDKTGQCKLYFKCEHCGYEWRSKAYKIEQDEEGNYRSKGFWNKFARPLAANWKGNNYLAIVLSKEKVLLAKPEKHKVVNANEVTLYDGRYKVNSDNIPSNLIGMEELYNAGYSIHHEVCKCGENIFFAKINNLKAVNCIEVATCRNCGKVHKSLRYQVDCSKLSRILRLKSIKSGNIFYGIDKGNEYLIYRKGIVESVSTDKVKVEHSFKPMI